MQIRISIELKSLACEVPYILVAIRIETLQTSITHIQKTTHVELLFFSLFRSKPMNENEANELFANEIESNKWTFSIYLSVHLFQCGKTDLCVLQYVGIQLDPGALICAVYALMKCYSSAILVRLSFTRCPA